MFELNFNDSRYLPFEGAGVISKWKIDMPKDNNHFDFASLSDVVLHVSYTARDGGKALSIAAVSNFKSKIPTETKRLFSLKDEFPTEWNIFLNSEETFVFDIKVEHLPFFMRNKFSSLEISKSTAYNNESIEEHNVTVTKDAMKVTITATDKKSNIGDNIYLLVEFKTTV